MNPTTTLPAYVQTALDRRERHVNRAAERVPMLAPHPDLTLTADQVSALTVCVVHAAAYDRIREEWMVS